MNQTLRISEPRLSWGQPRPQAHPDRLGRLGQLFGMTPAPAAGCRVLELGCRAGENLIPLAALLPDSQFVGIDIVPARIAAGREMVQQLGLTNLHLDVLDVREVPEGAGPFDYILAHGLFSASAPEVQEALLRVCGRNLASQGVAYVSYSTYPGRHGPEVIRDMLRYHTRTITDPQERLRAARTLLEFLAQNSTGPGAYYKLRREELARLRSQPDDHLLLQELAPCHQALYFREFVTRAAAYGLQFLAEAQIEKLDPARFGHRVPDLDEEAGTDLLAREQFLDFLTNRVERQTLLCRQDVALLPAASPEELASMRIAAAPGMESGAVRASSQHPLTAVALRLLAEALPQALPFPELEAKVQASLTSDEVVVQDPEACATERGHLLRNLLEAFRKRAVELHGPTTLPAAEPGEYPLVPAYVRLQAERGEWVTSLRHKSVAVDELSRFLLRQLDGTHDRRCLADLLQRHVAERGLVVRRGGRTQTVAEDIQSCLAEFLAGKLRSFARLGLLQNCRPAGPPNKGATEE